MAKQSYHPLLQELGVDNPQEGKEGAITSADLLTYLLTKNVVSESSVRDAHQELSATMSHAPSKKEAKKQKSTKADDNDTSSMKTSDYRTRHIALRFYYDGSKYTGLAENIGNEKDNSIEKALFAALIKARFVKSRHTCSYSRCGRTDRGVSAAGQVVALRLKSAFSPTASWDAAGTSLVETQQLPNNSLDKITVWAPPRNNKKQQQQQQQPTRQQKEMSEYAYDKILNSIFPDDVRILGWTPVSDDFSARFSATTRTYRYFFVRHSHNHMNIHRIQQGLDRMVGTHDFRNFCKMDVEKVYNFERTIHTAQVVVQDSDNNNNDSNNNNNNKNVCYIQIVGQAFLWHQIRCIASVLFLVGRGLEEPSIVTELLNVQKHPRKPAYPLAPEQPLVLHDCGYKDLEMGYSVLNMWIMQCHFLGQWEELVLAAARVKNCMDSLRDQQVWVRDVVEFCHGKLRDRQKKQEKRAASSKESLIPVSSTVHATELPQPATSTSQFMSWGDALNWMQEVGLFAEPDGVSDMVHIPLLERSKGTSYEEKVEAIQKSAKRKHRYEANIINKRQTKEEDNAFYAHMAKQGGSAVSNNTDQESITTD